MLLGRMFQKVDQTLICQTPECKSAYTATELPSEKMAVTGCLLASLSIGPRYTRVFGSKAYGFLT